MSTRKMYAAFKANHNNETFVRMLEFNVPTHVTEVKVGDMLQSNNGWWWFNVTSTDTNVVFDDGTVLTVMLQFMK